MRVISGVLISAFTTALRRRAIRHNKNNGTQERQRKGVEEGQPGSRTAVEHKTHASGRARSPRRVVDVRPRVDETVGTVV